RADGVAARQQGEGQGGAAVVGQGGGQAGVLRAGAGAGPVGDLPEVGAAVGLADEVVAQGNERAGNVGAAIGRGVPGHDGIDERHGGSHTAERVAAVANAAAEAGV